MTMTTMTTTAKKPRIKRDGTVRMNVSGDIEARLQRISEFYGVPPSTLAAVALGQWIAQTERALSITEKVVESMGEAVASEMRHQINLFTKGQDTET